MKACASLTEMKKIFFFLLLLSWLCLFSSCGNKQPPSSSSGGIFSKDETADAGNVVREANELLKKIKIRFKENEPKLQELKNALNAKDAAKVKELSTELARQISIGSEDGLEAIKKLKLAKEMNINDDFREYLNLKIIVMEKYIEAFEIRRQAAILLSENYDPKDAVKTERAKSEFKQKEEKFLEIMDDARRISQEANDLARQKTSRRN
jgi:hypothetical protein